jgi:uncharacterized protein YecT (DUF1311 family)
MMKPSFATALAAFCAACPFPVPALDCAKASQPVEKLLCASPELKQADDAMSAAYFKLLRETTAPEFHEALIRSQRRWSELRSRGVDRFGAAEGDKTDDREVLLKMTNDRLDFLRRTEPIRTMQAQQKIASKDSGGSFAGYETSCSFLPPPYGNWNYACWGAAHRQHHDRICSTGMQWASGHMTEYRLVSLLKNGEPKPVASCSTGYAGTNEPCPEPDDDSAARALAHWNTNPQPSNDLPAPHAGNLWKYEPDIDPKITDQPWMRDCLFAPVYPPPDISRSNSAPKK